MGGFQLQSPGFPTFPVDAKQLHYLVSNRYLEYPKLEPAVIEEKNHVDGLARYAHREMPSGNFGLRP